MVALSTPAPATALAQQPFLVDDAEVTPRRGWHFGVSSRADTLRSSARPVRWQNAFSAELTTGLSDRVDLGLTVPALSLVEEVGPGDREVTWGLSDLAVSAKYRLTRDPDAAHAWAASLTLGLPTGDSDRQLGSGLFDAAVNVISQHRLDDRWTARVNGGLVFAGNDQTGAVGVRERGTVITSGASLVRQVGRGSQIGGELGFAWSPRSALDRSFLGAQLGANLRLREGCTLDVGIGTGWFQASPRLLLQIGLSIDWQRGR